MTTFNSLLAWTSSRQETPQYTDKANLEKDVYAALNSKNYDIIQKVIPLQDLKKLCQVDNPTTLAQREVLLIPPLPQTLDEKRVHNLAHKVLTTFLMKIHYILSIPGSYYEYVHSAELSIGLFLTLRAAAGEFYSYFHSLHTSIHSNLSPKTAYFAEAAGALSLLALYYLYKKYNIVLAHKLEQTEFVNLIDKARAGKFIFSVGRDDTINELKSALSSTPLGKGASVFLVGPPGVGKTQIVEGVAKLIAEGKAPELENRLVYSVNTANFIERGTTRLENILHQIKGQESQVILFFDEAHSVSQSTYGAPRPSSFFEQIKTKFQDHNVTAIFATTDDEYQTHIQPNQALVERSRFIYLPSLDDDSTKRVLQNIALQTATETDPAAIDRIVEIMNTEVASKVRANPRKSIDAFEHCIKHFRLNIPTPPAHLPQDASSSEYLTLKLNCIDQNKRDPNWIATLEALNELKRLDELEKAQHTPDETEKEAAIQRAHQIKLKELHETLTLQQNRLIHHLNNRSLRNRENVEAEYLFTKYILLPQLKKLCADSKIPLKIDVNFVESCLNPTKKRNEQ